MTPFKKYLKAKHAKARKDGISPEIIRARMHRDDIYPQWWAEVMNAVIAGEVLDKDVLDDIWSQEKFNIIRNQYPKSVPDGYLHHTEKAALLDARLRANGYNPDKPFQAPNPAS